MSWLRRGDWLSSPAGLLAQQNRRAQRRLMFSIKGIEPRAKKSMPETDKDAVQSQLLASLVAQNRNAFRGPLALQVWISTTEKKPTHSHHIAKNLLDLFAKPRPSLPTRRRRLLYADDNQVHALAVTASHGEPQPRISVTADPLGSLIEDLRLVEQVSSDRDDEIERERDAEFDIALDHLDGLKLDEGLLRSCVGDGVFDYLRHSARRNAQRLLLGRATLRPIGLAHMFDVMGGGADIAKLWEETFASTSLRITLSELPQVDGGSTRWKQEIERKLRDFQAQWGWLVNPLLVPVALEVVIKPPPLSRQRGLHDLDNVLRSYLIPRVVEILNPVSHFSFAFNDANFRNVSALLNRAQQKSESALDFAMAKQGPTRATALPKRLPEGT
jgi:hypothetical protein